MEEINAWMRKAESDIESAVYNLKGKRFDVAAFLSQQAAEKALKALYILRFKELWRTHDLVKLSQKLSAPKNVIDMCDRLTQHYVATRYPVDVEDEYSEEDAKEAVSDSRGVIEWVRKKLEK